MNCKNVFFWTVVFCLLLTGAALAKTEITFWHAMAGQLGDAVEHLTAQFNAENPDIVVESIFQGHYDDLNMKLVASIPAKTTPTLAQVYENWTDVFIRNGVLVPLEDYLNLSSAEYEDYIEAFRKMNTWEGKLYTIPYNKCNYILLYNTELIPEPPRTLEEFVETARAVAAQTGGETAGFGLRATLEVFHAFLYLNGGDLLGEDLTVTLNGPEGQAALELLNQLIDEGAALLVDGFEDAAFGEQLIAMYISSSAGLSFVEKSVGDKFKFGAALLPAGERGGTPFMGTNIALFKSASEAERIAAAKFVRFLTNTENTAYFAMKTGYLPVTYSGLNSPEYQRFLEDQPHKAVVASPEAFASAYWQPTIGVWEEARRTIIQAVEKVLLSRATIADALGEAKLEIEDYILEMLETN